MSSLLFVDTLFDRATQCYGGDLNPVPRWLVPQAAAMVVGGLAGIVAGDERSEQAIAEELRDPSVRWRVFSQPGELLGFAAWYTERNFQGQGVSVVYLQELHVACAAQRQGVASLLLRAVEAAGRTDGAVAMVAKVDKANTVALTCYKQYGMRDVCAKHPITQHEQVRIKFFDEANRCHLSVLPRTEVRRSRFVQPSDDAGYGLFLVAAAKEGDHVISYDEGIPMSHRLDADPGNCQHLAWAGAEHFLDGDVSTCDAAKANSGGRREEDNNAKIVVCTRTHTAYLMLTRDTEAGEEIRWNYGRHYRSLSRATDPLAAVRLPRDMCLAVATLMATIRERPRDRTSLDAMVIVCDALPLLMRERVQADERQRTEAEHLQPDERKRAAHARQPANARNPKKRPKKVAPASAPATAKVAPAASAFASAAPASGSAPAAAPASAPGRPARCALPTAPVPPCIRLLTGASVVDEKESTKGLVAAAFPCLQVNKGKPLPPGWAVGKVVQHGAGGETGQDFALLTVLATSAVMANGGSASDVVRYSHESKAARVLLSPLGAKAFKLAMAIPVHKLVELRVASKYSVGDEPPCERIELLRDAGLHTSLDSGLALPDLSSPAVGKAWWVLHLASVAVSEGVAGSLGAFDTAFSSFRAACTRETRANGTP
jgi:GNAT superfamily N-acetyltransferase